MLDTIELTLWQPPGRKSSPRRVQLVRSHILRWMPEHSGDGTIIKQMDGEQVYVAQSYELVTHLLTSDESEDADHGIIDPRD